METGTGGAPNRKGFRAGFRGGDPAEGADAGGVAVVGLVGLAGLVEFALGVPGAGNAGWGAPKGDPNPPYPPAPPKGEGPAIANALRNICCRVSGLDLGEVS